MARSRSKHARKETNIDRRRVAWAVQLRSHAWAEKRFKPPSLPYSFASPTWVSIVSVTWNKALSYKRRSTPIFGVRGRATIHRYHRFLGRFLFALVRAFHTRAAWRRARGSSRRVSKLISRRTFR